MRYGGGQSAFATETNAQSASDLSAKQGAIDFIDSNDSTNQNATNQNADSIGDSNAKSDSTAPSLLDKVLGLGDTMRGKSDIYDLGRIERTVGGDADENSTVAVVSSEAMEQEGARDVAHALRFTPGVFYMPQNNGKGTVYIRGFGEEATGFYFDGIPINDIYDGNAAGATDLTPFFTFGLSEIQVSKGYTSPTFSSGKMGGALNMVTSKPKDKLELRAGYMFIANNEHRANAQVGSNWGNQYFQLTYSFMTRKSLNRSYNYNGEGPAAISNSSYKNHFITGKYGWTPNGNHEYSLNFYFQNAQRLPSFPHYDKTAFYILGHSQLSKLVSLDSKLWYHMNANQSGTREKWSSLYDDYSLGITESIKLDFSDSQNLKVGFTIKNDNHKAVDYPLSWAKRNWHILNSSIFTEYALRVNDIFRFVVSGSYDRQDGLRVTNNSDYNKKDKNQHIQGWALQGIGYVSLGEYVLLHANVGHKTNFPKLRTLYGNGMRLAENKNLTDESLINAEIGSTFDWVSGQISAVVFYNYIHNKIITTQVDSTLCAMPVSGSNGNSYCYRYENAKDGWSVGAEVSIKQGFWDDKLVLGANWTYIHRVTNRYNNNGTKAGSREFTTHPRQNINFNILFAPSKYFDVNLMGSVQTSRWAYRANTDDYVSIPTVFYFDLVANYYVTNAFKLTFGAYNLFDRNYNYSTSATGNSSAFVGGLPGRRVFAGFEYRF